MILAREKYGKKLIFLSLIFGLITFFVFFMSPSNIFIITMLNIIVSAFFFFLFKVFFEKKLAFSLTLPIFLILILLSLKLFDPLNLTLIVFFSIAVAVLIR
ncbi:MAG: hypothetical protein WCT22_02320 [Patescibacteria group bacterium]|jgi:hypothetical protein